MRPDDTLDDKDPAGLHKILLIPGDGVALPADATPAAKAMARCLGDVMARVPADADLTRLSPEQEAELLDWDAEKYRQTLNRTAHPTVGAA